MRPFRAMGVEEGCHPSTRQQHRLVEVQIEAVDLLDIKGDVFGEKFGDRLSYQAHRRRLTAGLVLHRHCARLSGQHGFP